MPKQDQRQISQACASQSPDWRGHGSLWTQFVSGPAAVGGGGCDGAAQGSRSKPEREWRSRLPVIFSRRMEVSSALVPAAEGHAHSDGGERANHHLHNEPLTPADPRNVIPWTRSTRRHWCSSAVQHVTVHVADCGAGSSLCCSHPSGPRDRFRAALKSILMFSRGAVERRQMSESVDECWWRFLTRDGRDTQDEEDEPYT